MASSKASCRIGMVTFRFWLDSDHSIKQQINIVWNIWCDDMWLLSNSIDVIMIYAQNNGKAPSDRVLWNQNRLFNVVVERSWGMYRIHNSVAYYITCINSRRVDWVDLISLLIAVRQQSIDICNACRYWLMLVVHCVDIIRLNHFTIENCVFYCGACHCFYHYTDFYCVF